MKVALAQMEVIAGNPKQNLETMLRMIAQAKQQQVDLIAFPEMCVGGYLVGDKWVEDAFCADLMEFNEVLRKASDGIAITYGNICLDDRVEGAAGPDHHPNKDGRTRKYNAVYVLQNGKPAERMQDASVLPSGVQPKTLLPNYRVFDDERYFFSLEDVAKDAGVTLESLAQPFLIEVNGKKVPVGFELCEDLWCEDYRVQGKALNPTKMLIDNGAEFIINLSASPWTYGKNAARDRRVQFLKQEAGETFTPFLYVNCTGVQNNGKNLITFDGGSTAYSAAGMPVQLANQEHREELLIVDAGQLGELPLQQRVEKSKIAQKEDAIIAGIRHVQHMVGSAQQPKWVIGLSGGIDSAVVAALLTRAVGADRVLGVNMPTEYNSEKTKQAAAQIAEALGIPYVVVPIGEMVTANVTMLNGANFDGRGRTLTPTQLGNVHAKIRGTSVLSNIAAMYGALFTNNGNKLEVALGYATLYGDVGGAIAPIADLTKTEVVEMAKHLNAQYGREVIPAAVIPDALFRFRADQIQPSAELEKDQVDPMRFGYHCALLDAFTDYQKKTPTDVMQWYQEGTLEEHLGIPYAMIKRWGIDTPKTFVEDLEWFDRQMQRSVFKRVQSPPIILTSKSAYGYDIRESILPVHTTQAYERLKQQVLSMDTYVPRQLPKISAEVAA